MSGGVGMARASVPLELSFRGISSVADISVCTAADQEERGEIVRPEKTAEELAARAGGGLGVGGGEEEEEEPLEPIAKPFRAVRLDNNALENIEGLSAALQSVVVEVGEVGWVDLSLNRITSIAPDAFRHMPSLRSLYLHGNEIASMRHIVSLAKQVPNLASLTLHGNPLREIENYRPLILSIFPKLTKLDFVPVTPREREDAERHKEATGGKIPLRTIVAPGPTPIPSPPGSHPREAFVLSAASPSK